MKKWDKNVFVNDLQKNCSREVVKVCRQIIDFSEEHASLLSWGRGTEYGTMTFRCSSDVGDVPIFHLSSDGRVNLQINFLRGKDLPKMVLRDMIVKLESNFLMEYDSEMYPADSFVSIEELFHTKAQVDKFLKTIERCVYRLKQ